MNSFVRQLTQFTRIEVDTLFQNAKPTLKSKYAIILAAKAKKDFGRILIVISKKVGHAPTRNRLRRRLKTIFYEEKLYDLKYDFIFITRKPILELSFQNIKELLFLAKEKLLCQN